MKLPFQYDNQTIDTARHLAGVALLCVLGVMAGAAGLLWIAQQRMDSEREAKEARSGIFVLCTETE
jgi:hypothetical protein